MEKIQEFEKTILGTAQLFQYLSERTDGRKSKIEAFCDLLDKASKGFVSSFLRNQDCKLLSCQCNVTITELASEWKWHRATVRSFIDKLENYGQLTKQKLPKSVIITMPVKAGMMPAENGKVQKTFHGKLEAVVSKWVVGTIDDEELVDAVTELIHNEAILVDASYGKAPSAKAPNSKTKLMEAESEESRQMAIDNIVKIVIDELVLATFIKTIKSYCPEGGSLMQEFLHEVCADSWSSFLDSIKNLARLILGYSFGSYGTTEEIESYSEPFKGALAGRLINLVNENAPN